MNTRIPGNFVFDNLIYRDLDDIFHFAHHLHEMDKVTPARFLVALNEHLAKHNWSRDYDVGAALVASALITRCISGCLEISIWQWPEVVHQRARELYESLRPLAPAHVLAGVPGAIEMAQIVVEGFRAEGIPFTNPLAGITTTFEEKSTRVPENPSTPVA